jgi:hypothetical protein
MKQTSCFQSLLATVAVTIALSGCSTAKTKVDSGSIKARTFSFLNTGGRQAPPSVDNRQQANALVQQAIANSLAARGVSQTASGGDVTVAYLIIIGNGVSTTSLNEYFGYTDDSNSLVEKAHSQQSKRDDRTSFEAGTLVIDFLDPHTSKVLQRRTIKADLLQNVTMEQRSARLQGLVNDALKNVPLAQ